MFYTLLKICCTKIVLFAENEKMVCLLLNYWLELTSRVRLWAFLAVFLQVFIHLRKILTFFLKKDD